MRVSAALDAAFDWTHVATRRRAMSVARYDAHAPGIAAHLERLARDGVVRVRRAGPYYLWDAHVVRAVRR